MKILHTSDWHLGHTLYNYDRTEEQTDMLRQIADIVRQRKPDVFILAGDVYHTAQPSAAVQTMFTNAMVEIHKANPQMTVVVTAGNHDSGARHEIFRTPWRALNVFAVGNIDKDDISAHIIEVEGKGFVVAVPYASGRNIQEGFFQHLLDEVDRRNRGKELPVVMTAHTTVRGCDFTGHDNASEYAVGGIDTIDISQMGEGYDYLALGHIHHAQFVHTGRHNVRYSGTPLAVSFDESYAHSVSIVEIGKHGDRPEIEEIEIENIHPLVSLPADGAVAWEEAKERLANFPADIAAYIRLNVEIDDFLPAEASAEAGALTEGKQCRFCLINSRRRQKERVAAKILTVQEFQAERPVDITRRYAEDIGIEFDDEMREMFNETLSMLNEESRDK